MQTSVMVPVDWLVGLRDEVLYPLAKAAGPLGTTADGYGQGIPALISGETTNGWQPIETCPEDENVLVATTGGWVDTAFWTDEDGEGRKWWWLISAKEFAKHPIHPNLVPTHWMPLPKQPEAA